MSNSPGCCQKPDRRLLYRTAVAVYTVPLGMAVQHCMGIPGTENSEVSPPNMKPRQLPPSKRMLTDEPMLTVTNPPAELVP